MVSIIVDLGANLAQRQIDTANVVDHKYVALHYLQLHVVLCGGTLDAQQHCIRFGCDEAQRNVVLLRVGLRVLREVVLHHALVVAKLVGN